MAWVSPAYSVADIIRHAARHMREQRVVEGKDPLRLQMYYDAFNKALRSVGMSRNWWFLNREAALATKSGQKVYALRSQASGTVTVSGAPVAGQAVTLNGTAYTFTSTGAASASAAIAELISLVNAGTQAYALQTSSTTVELYWAGDDGYGLTLTDNATNVTTDSTLDYSMPDFSKLTAIRWYNNFPLTRTNPLDIFNATVLETNGQPAGYAMTQGEATLRVYSPSHGAPDGIYLLQLRYQAMPSAVLPDGTGQLDFPVQFHDLFPHLIQLILKMEIYDEAAVMGDQLVQRRLSELESFCVDQTPLETQHEYDLPTLYIDRRVDS